MKLCSVSADPRGEGGVTVEIESSEGAVLYVREVNKVFEVALATGYFLMRPAMSNVVYLEARAND